jgi:hypothetical protein
MQNANSTIAIRTPVQNDTGIDAAAVRHILTLISPWESWFE